MSDYRLQPSKTGGYLAFILAFSLLVLGSPALISSVLPDSPRAAQPVVLDALDRKEPIEGLACPPNPDAESNGGWKCGQASVDYYAYPKIEDGDLLLRRTLRLASFDSYSSIPSADHYLADEAPLNSQTASFLADPKAHTAAISVHGTGEHAQDFYVVTIAGPKDEVTETAGKIWQSLANEDLPQPALAELQEFDKYSSSDKTAQDEEKKVPA